MMNDAAPPDTGPVAPNTVVAELIAVLVAIIGGEPCVMTLRDGAVLPSGPFEAGHRSLQTGLRAWVERQTRHPLGYVEQLYTFADGDRLHGDGRHHISISYLGLTRETGRAEARGTAWRSWYEVFPWEDHRGVAPGLVARAILPRLRAWADDGGADAAARHRRVGITFGDGADWNEELILQRYELLYEAGLVAEAGAQGDIAARLGAPMLFDHRRILATGIARLRAKIKYRPVVFELMPATFTLFQLQRTVEAIAGRLLHKQNFRRLVEQQDLLEETGETTPATGGRPAKLFRFRGAVLAERAIAGTKLPVART
jgi:hypothetical protein